MSRPGFVRQHKRYTTCSLYRASYSVAYLGARVRGDIREEGAGNACMVMKLEREGRHGMFYFTTHSTHFYLRLYGVGHMGKDHGDIENETRCPHTWATLSDYQQGFFYMHHPTDRIVHTTSFFPHTPVWSTCGTRNSSSVSTMRDRSDDPLHQERKLYVGAMRFISHQLSVYLF